MYLNCHSYYSFLFGTLAPDELVRLGKLYGCQTLAFTDINNTSGWFDFLTACKKEEVNGLVGVEFRHQNQVQFIGIPKNKQGRYELNYFLSEYLAQGSYDPGQIDFKEVYVIYPFGVKSVHELSKNEYLGIRKSELTQIYAHECLKYPEKLLALSPVTFRDSQDFHTHHVLQAIDQNALLSKLDTRFTAKSDEYFQPIEQVEHAFAQYPFLIENAKRLLANCTMEMEEGFLYSPKNRKSFTGSPGQDLEMLRSLALKGYERRYGESLEALDRIEKELSIIHELHFSAYFLITYDIIQFAGSKGYHHVGRGSGANSIVAYCLGISNVDPLELDLYFERFINPYRTSPPDFDIDFSWDERDDVIQYVFDRYEKGCVCL
ncbi:MAG: PHP domain-containing protein, partial [Cytophagales bacterium]|nr:PHP domain-containing protein [Cytophagales bacterium]